MLRRLALIITCYWGFTTLLTAQTTNPGLPSTGVYGKVTDATTKEPLPYVNVRFVGSVKSTQTDPRGEYLLRTIERVDSISFSFVGYRTRTIAIKRGAEQGLNIEMGSSELKLTEITVKAGKKHKRVIDTAANYVFYQVLKYKNENRSEHVKSYKFESYEKLMVALLNPSQKLINFFLFKPFKFAFKNVDTTEDGHVFIPGILKESTSTVYYRQHPKATKKFITGEKLSGIDNPSVGNLANYHFAEINAYDNLFVIAGQSFASPFAPTAMLTYIYYLTDTAKIDGRISYKLHFVGKVKEDQVLKGFAWIDSATWAIRSIVFRPNEKSNLNFVNDYTIKQEFTYVNNKYWLLQHEEMHTVGSILKKSNISALLITKTYDRRNFETDIDFPDSIFKGVEDLVLLDSARHRSNGYWDTSRYVGLTKQEKEVYHIADTFRTVRAWKTYEWFGRFLTVAYADAGPISIGRILNFASYNNVEGWRLRFGFETNPRFQHPGTPANDFLRTFYFNGYVAYGLRDKVWQYLAQLRINLPRKNDRWQSLDVTYRYDLRVPGQDEESPLLTFDNIITLLSGKAFSKIMRVREARITYEKEWVRGFSTMTYLNQKTYYDIPGVFNFSRQDGINSIPIPHFDITEFTLDTRYSYNNQYFVSGFYRFFVPTRPPVFTLRYSAGLVNMQGAYYNYHSLQLGVKQRLSSPAGHTNYSFKAAKIFGRVPYTAAYITEGNLGYLLDKFNYGLLNEFEFVTDQYLSLWVEHHFDGFFFNKIPLVNKLRLREVIFAKSLIGTFDQRNAGVLSLPVGIGSPSRIPYTEAGFGIENIAYCIRVDFVWRLTYRDRGPTWGVKFAFSPGF
jgi:hypothetical protein